MPKKLLFFIFIGLYPWAKSLFSQPAEVLMNQAFELDSAGKWNAAAAKYTQIIDQNPTLAVAWYNRGLIQLKRQKYSAALVDFNKCIFLDTSLHSAYFARALSNKLTQNYQFALADIDMYLKYYKNDADALLEKGEILILLQDWKEAETVYEKLLTLASIDREKIELQLAQIYQNNKNYVLAEKIYSKLIFTNPKSDFYLFLRAKFYFISGKYENSLQDIAQLSVIDNEALHLKAENYFYLKRFEDAIYMYSKLHEKDSFNGDLISDIGHCKLQLAKFGEAEILLTQAIQYKTSNPAYAYLGRGIARQNLNKGAEACQDWEKSKMLGEKKAQTYLNQYCLKIQHEQHKN